jgi:uncharacterized protein YodC (DUF2158 family)
MNGNMEKIKSGDLVRLVSGGPVMLITEIREYSRRKDIKAVCIWINGNGRNECEFTFDVLRKLNSYELKQHLNFLADIDTK